jgi:murein DD-endopeptidase MepM/ murein hydrolase activator NlpD
LLFNWRLFYFMRTYLSFLNKVGAKAQAGIAVTALAAIVATSALFPSAGITAFAGNAAAPSNQGSIPFLTLPFEAGSNMSMLSGWYYSSSGGLHNGIDYINGNSNGPRGWGTFPVIAAADGLACGNCSSRQGNAVWIQHKVNGATFYTYYGHLASISSDIPVGSQSRTVAVKRGQFLGWAGDTGSRGALHLHFALYNASSRALDPYGIHKLRQHYPKPTDNSPGIGWFIEE